MLINPKIPVYLRMPSLPLGLVSIASYLNAYGHRAVIIELSVKAYDLRAEIEAFQPDVIGISALSYLSSLSAKKLTARLRRFTSVPVIWGGQGPSSQPELILRDGAPDFVMLGEGELTWLAVADALQRGEPLYGIEGLAYLKDGAFFSNPIRPVADLFQFPELDWTLVDPPKYFTTFFHCRKMLYLHASKGCPAACIFCSNKQFHQGCNRCRDPKHVMRDISYFVETCGADGIYFSDELFLPRRELRNELCNALIEKNYELVWDAEFPQFKKPDSIRRLAKDLDQNATDLIRWNFSEVSTRELRVIHFFFQWKDFIGKESVNQDRYGILKKMAGDAFNRMFRHGFRGFLFGTYVSVKQFATVYFYSHFFPKIRKQYGLRLK